MTNTKLTAGILLLFLGMSFSIYANDQNLNGIWAVSEDGMEMELRMEDGNYMASVNSMPMQRGTYTTIAGTIVMTTTHVHKNMFPRILTSGKDWYTIDELKQARMPDQIINSISQNTSEYTVRGNRLTISFDDELMTLTKR